MRSPLIAMMLNTILTADGLKMAEHSLKRFFASPPGRVDVDCSPSYAQGLTMQDLLAMEFMPNCVVNCVSTTFA